MYRNVSYDPTGMGFSLKPPAWLRNIVSKVSSGAQQVEAATTAVASNYQAPGPSGATPAAAELPPWLIPAGLGLLAVLFLMRGRRA